MSSSSEQAADEAATLPVPGLRCRRGAGPRGGWAGAAGPVAVSAVTAAGPAAACGVVGSVPARSAVAACPSRVATISARRAVRRTAAGFSGSMASAFRANSSAVRSSPRSDATRARPTTAIAFRGSVSTACQ